MDPMRFDNGLEPKRDVLNNALNSPFFSKLPGELRNTIYSMIFTQTLFGKDAPRGVLSPSALRTCRQFYVEAVAYLYACNTHKIAIEPDLAVYHAAPRIPSQFIWTRNISAIRRLKLEIHLPKDRHSRTISLADILSAEVHLRGICLCLASNGVVLESLKISIFNGHLVDPNMAFYLLDTLKELRVERQVRVLGIETNRSEGTHELIRDVTNEMMAPDVIDSDGTSQVTVRGMCQDLWDFLNMCIEHVQEWPEDTAGTNEKAAALEELRLAFEVENGLRGEMFFPPGSKPMELFQRAITSIEAIYTKIDRDRFGQYHLEATRARERLFMRKAFREMVPYEVPDLYAFD
ncbi:hypothetical protein MMC07_007489 [Pseudocyphellaria aurata]|nr:hypothetical protein [Pseudocyphellaria aurata]